MRVVITGGGTGGHTSAGLAVAAALSAHGADVHWIGSHHGVEARRVPETGLPYYPIRVGKLRRYWDWSNVTDLSLRVPAGFVRSWQLLRQLRPALVFATGGFVALPPAVAAAALRIPLIVHEQTAVPGLANRIAGRFARRVALTFPIGEGFPADRCVVTGNPLRPDLAGGSREAGCRTFGLDPAAPVIYVTGGSLGAHRINRTVGEVVSELVETTQVIHQCGDHPTTGDHAWLAERRNELPAVVRSRYVLIPYVGPQLCHVYAAADLVVGRSGGGTVNECCHLGRPAIYVPLPGASGDEQTANARLVERTGGAVVLPQHSLTAAELSAAIRKLLADPDLLRAMGERARSLAVPDAAERIARLAFEVARA